MTRINRILIVDDNFINRQYFSMSLKKSGFSISTAEDGFEAIEKSIDLDFDVILMDIRMPQMDGYETTLKIKALQKHKNTPILATSAESIDKDKKHLFQGIILKPISPKELLKIVNSVCNNCQNTSEVFDKSHALKFAYNDEDIMYKIISMFIKELPITMCDLTTGISNQEYIHCVDLIHKARGSCKSCGAVDLDWKFKNLSKYIENHDYDCMDDALIKLQGAVEKYQIKVKTKLKL